MMKCLSPRLLLFLTLVLPLTPVYAQEQIAPRSIEALVGEDLAYYMDFLVFKQLAAGELRLLRTEQPHVFKAELIGRTLGIAAWLAGDRIQSYSTVMEQAPDGSLRGIEHVSRIHKRSFRGIKDRGKRHRYDYAARQVTVEKARDGVYRPGEAFAFPKGVDPVDMLSAFYNLRTGVYGPLVRGAKFSIPTFSSDGFSDIKVAVLTAEEQAHQAYFPRHGMLLRITLDPEVFDTGSGNIFVWLNAAGVPESGIVEDVIGLGDVKGYQAEVVK